MVACGIVAITVVLLLAWVGFGLGLGLGMGVGLALEARREPVAARCARERIDKAPFEVGCARVDEVPRAATAASTQPYRTPAAVAQPRCAYCLLEEARRERRQLRSRFIPDEE